METASTTAAEVRPDPFSPPASEKSDKSEALIDANDGVSPALEVSDSSAGSNSSGALHVETRTNLIVNYLPQTMSQEDFRALFAKMGTIESCKLVRDKATGQSLGYGFVNYARPEDAESAVNTLNALPLQTKTIKVSFARPSSDTIKGANLYVNGLPKSMTAAELEALFQPYGRIIASRILTDQPSGQSRGVGFVRFDKRNQAETAIEKLNGTVPPGATEPLCVKFANNPAGSASAAAQKHSAVTPAAAAASALMPLALLNAQSRRFQGPIHHAATANRFRYSPLGTPDLLAGSLISAAAAAGLGGSSVTGQASAQGIPIFVYNLSPEVEEARLWQLFGPFGAVLNVKIVRDQQTSKCRGYAFVTMVNYEEALTAIAALDGFMLDNRKLQVSFKTTGGRRMHQ